MFNDLVLDVASSVPDAIKLIATLADVVDEPVFIDISSKYNDCRQWINTMIKIKPWKF